jgi:hypothetical protein
MSFLVAGFGYVVEDHLILAEFGADGSYTLPDEVYPQPIEQQEDETMEECVNQMFNLELQAAAVQPQEQQQQQQEESHIDDVPDSVSSSSIKDIFDDFRINCKVVINKKLTDLIGTIVYMTVFNNYAEGHTAAMFTFHPPLVSKTCFMKSHDLTAEHICRPPYIGDDDIIALAKCLKRSAYPAAFVFHGLLDDL